MVQEKRYEIKIIIVIFMVLSAASCTQSNKKVSMGKEKYLYTNKLIHESSPYLRQHAHNPVNWYPWGPEALEKAKRENKLILVSIGYSACHWCHVMEQESFENPEIAAYMNANYVAIKVDREERPDIDQIYMNAVQLLSGRGGWPLNCIALPDGRPIYGGTYFPPAQWIDMLQQVNNFVKLNPEKTEEQARNLTSGIQTQESIYSDSNEHFADINDLKNIFSNWKNQIDFKEGGSLGAPKFPLPTGYQFLLQFNYLTDNEDALKTIRITLDKMASGGIYDHLGGGFSRYSVDEKWIVPHFEKMLYDNAQLVSLYSFAFQKTKEPVYQQVVEETLDFILRELYAIDGGFYASLDADSEGIEGKYYVWEYEEIKNILKDNADSFIALYNIEKTGNWEEGLNILYTRIPDQSENLAGKFGLSVAAFKNSISKSENILFIERSRRIHPGRDEKILTAWNAMMIKGFTDAFVVFNNEKYLDIALKNTGFLLGNLISDNGQVFRNYKDGKVTINGFLDDYAFTISAFIGLYRATFNEKWLIEAKKLNDYTLEHFYDAEKNLFYYTSDLDPELIARKFEITDNVIPSSNSEMAKNLYLLGKYFSLDDYLNIAKKMYGNIKDHTLSGGAYFANWDILASWLISPPCEVVILGKDFQAIRKEFEKYYLPNILMLGGVDEGSIPLMKNRLVPGQTTIYVCQDRTCQLPTTDFELALKQIGKKHA